MNRFVNLEQGPEKFTPVTYRLDRVREYMKCLGNPQDRFKTVHIAGSKGKGSTAAFVANAISSLGYRTGLYLSPHVSDYRERFTLSGRFIDEKTLLTVAEELREKTEGFSFNGTRPTVFELYTAYAFLLFSALKCDWAVIETGLGGRLDATNVIEPQICIFTPVELEHTEILGNTLEKIAIEKSKIIKHGAKVFTAFQDEKVLDVLRREADCCSCPITELKENLLSLKTSPENGLQKTRLKFSNGFSADLNLRMIGEAQALNAALALLVVRETNLYRSGTTEKAIEDTVLPGRFEKLTCMYNSVKRNIYIDGAHTPLSIQLLMDTWEKSHSEKSGVCIFGCVEGKKYNEMEKSILTVFRKIVVSEPGSFKKSSPGLLFNNLIRLTQNDGTCRLALKEKTEDALSWALENSAPDEDILVCGSFYLAGAVKDTLKKQLFHSGSCNTEKKNMKEL